MFFAPCFRPETEITIWGPASPEASLEDRIARYISAPLSPVEVRELPCSVSFRDTPAERVADRPGDDPRRVRHPPRPDARLPDHRRRRTVCYIPDHEPGLGTPLADLEPEWISGYDLARDADLLIHDCQYTDEEYPEHVGWGHSPSRRHSHLRPAGRGASDCCSSTTTPATPTTSSIASTTRLGSAGRSSAARTAPWRWRPRLRSSRSAPLPRSRRRARRSLAPG